MITDQDAQEMARLITERVNECELDLRGMVVVTEAATNSYASTAAVATLAGAEVWAYQRATPHGSAEEACRDVSLLVASLGANPSCLRFTGVRSVLPWADADVVTNSGVLRPILQDDIEAMSSGATIALMYEAWEARSTDIDFEAAATHGVEVIGVNERHPLCGAFDFLGNLVLAALERRAWNEAGAAVVVLSDNDFGETVVFRLIGELPGSRLVSDLSADFDADIVVVATTPLLSGGVAEPGLVTDRILRSGASRVIQLWGDIDRGALEGSGISLEPVRAPRPGHQGLGMAEAGFEPVIRLQVAGLAAVLHKEAIPGSRPYGLAQRRIEQKMMGLK